MKAIELVLSREIGLAVRSIGSNALAAAVLVRMEELGIQARAEYAARLEIDAAERRALVEEIVVSETWFFRDEEVFRTLQRHVRGAWQAAHPGRVLRVLSIPCATGEEAYSVVMLLLELGLSPEQFEVVAVDVSERALAVARQGSYGRNSFRGTSAASRRHYFEAAGDELRLVPAVRSAVTFSQGNVLNAYPVWSRAPFDVIFCRNLLIYLDAEARARALDNLKRWLAADGILFAGHAETLDTMDAGLKPLDRAVHFAYVKRGNDAAPARVPAPPQPAPRAVPKRQASSAAAKPARAAPLLASVPAASSVDPLANALDLANRGRVEEAARLCERHLTEQGASAEAYCLLGVVKQAAGDGAAAMECFDKALYLDPRHYEALVHLALLCEQRGDRGRAENLRRRAERAQVGRRSP